jgi:hypothetical protein
MTKNGIQEGNAYSYILHKPSSKIYHTNTLKAETGFTDNWVYLKDDYINHLVEYMFIPIDTIVPVQNNAFITKIIGKIQIELSQNLPFKKERIDSLVTALFIGLSRNTNFQHLSIQNYNAFTAISNIFEKLYKKILIKSGAYILWFNFHVIPQVIFYPFTKNIIRRVLLTILLIIA